MPRVVCAILGGGRGTRLFPLTKERCKPAVPLAGKYRLIDVPISNCLNSGYGAVFVLTQFNTASLHRHISRSYPFDALSGRSVQILAAEQTLERTDWYQGTADAIRQNLRHLGLEEAEHVLILSGDHLYRMNYADMIRRHSDAGADITVAVQPVTASAARGFGVVKLTSDGLICEFAEKPGEELLDEFALPEPAGRDCDTGELLTHMASMGIYCFRPEVLRELLADTDAEDFGKHVIPRAISSQRVAAFAFTGYWEDIGTIPAFYRANLDLVGPVPRFNLFDSSWPIYTRARYLPPAKVNGARMEAALVGDGAVVGRADVVRSIIGLRGIVGDGSVLEDTVTMGNDFYEEPSARVEEVPLGIGPRCRIRGAIIDKNARIGEGVVIEGRPGCGVNADAEQYYVRDGIVIVPRSQVLPPGTHIVV